MIWQKMQNYLFGAFVSVLLGSAVLYIAFEDSFDLEKMRQFLDGLGIWAPLAFIALYTVGTIFIPSTPFMAIAGILFGFKNGLLYTVLGGLFSSVIVFAIARRLGKSQMEKFLESRYLKRLDGYNKKLEKGAVWDLILFRMTPIMPFNALNVLMGISKIKIRDYVAGTLLGLIPSNILTVYFGNLLTRFFS